MSCGLSRDDRRNKCRNSACVGVSEKQLPDKDDPGPSGNTGFFRTSSSRRRPGSRELNEVRCKVDTRGFLDQILQAGRELADKGLNTAGDRIGIPEAGPERDAALSNMGKGALAAGALALLLGTSGGRKLTGSALKIGSLAALGGLAYKAYNDWQAGRPVPAAEENDPASMPIDRVFGPGADGRSQRLVRAMIEAARSDGHVDELERGRIGKKLAELGLDTDIAGLIKDQLDKPLDAQSVAAGAASLEEAAEIYLVSRVVIDVENPAELAYLDELARALELAPDFVSMLEQELGHS